MNIFTIERIINKVSNVYQYTKARLMYQIVTFGSLLTINEKEKFPCTVLDFGWRRIFINNLIKIFHTEFSVS